MAGSWDPNAFEFRDGFRHFIVSRDRLDGALDPRSAAWVIRRHLEWDSFFAAQLVGWFQWVSMSSGLADSSQVLRKLLAEVEWGSIRVREVEAPLPVYSHRYPEEVRDTPRPASLQPAEEIVEDARSLLITHCPPQFDPRREPLWIAYLLRDLEDHPVELVIRSRAKPEPPVHRRALTSAETADGPGKLEWAGFDDATGELVQRDAAPFTIELVHNTTYRDQAETTLPPATLVHVVEMEDLMFASGREILMPDGGFDESAEEGHDRATGLHAIAAVLRHAAFHRGQKLCVFGHTDTVGTDADNLQLSADRALNVLHVLTGDADAWAAHCDQHYEVADFQRVLKWVALTKGWPTDPGAIDNEFGNATRTARNNFRALMNEHYTTQLQQGVKQSVNDWKAYFTLFDEELCRILGATPEDLARIRGELELADPGSVGCGEAFPADQPGVNNLESAANRRVDVVFFEPHELPALPGEPPGAPLYGTKDYEARYLPIGKGGGKVPVLLRLLDGEDLLAGEQYVLEREEEILDYGTSKSDGTIFADLPRDVPGILLRLPRLGRTYELDVAALPPVSEMAGAQGRLSNLGYPCSITGELDDETRDALLAFQRDRNLPPTGTLDGDTLPALHSIHDV